MPTPTGPRRPERIAIAAFAGWNDAGNAATDALEFLQEQLGAALIAELDTEEYHDLQVMRPHFRDEGSERILEWPRTKVFEGGARDGRPVIFIDGIEPSMRWEQYCAELLAILIDHGADRLIILGALLADVPHTRAIPVQATSSDPDLRERLGLEASEYTGPTGIVGVLEFLASTEYGVPALSMWAAVPHYVANPPSPKAILALLTQVEELTGLVIDTEDLPEEARAWQEGVDELAAEDSDVADYVRQLETAKDAADAPEASGEALAREFERYLKRRENGGGRARG
jgi:proteasome assembly chaperone (PAC2) family protein